MKAAASVIATVFEPQLADNQRKPLSACKV